MNCNPILVSRPLTGNLFPVSRLGTDYRLVLVSLYLSARRDFWSQVSEWTGTSLSRQFVSIRILRPHAWKNNLVSFTSELVSQAIRISHLTYHDTISFCFSLVSFHRLLLVLFSPHSVSVAIGTSHLTSRNTCPSHSRLTLSHHESEFLVLRLIPQNFRLILVSLSDQISRFVESRLVDMSLEFCGVGGKLSYFVHHMCERDI